MAATEPNPTEKPGQSHWDHEVDLLVVGSGAGGFTAALAGAAEGLDTLLIEKSDVYGGATALSGGGVWVPNNPLLIREGLGDSRADVRRYLDAVLGDRVPSANVDAFIDEGPKTLEFLETSSPHMRFQWCTGYSDYHPSSRAAVPRAGRSSRSPWISGSSARTSTCCALPPSRRRRACSSHPRTSCSSTW